MKASQFFTRQTAEEGIRKDLPLPDGTASGVHITIRGTDSDTFRTAARESAREKAAAGALPEGPGRDSAFLSAHLRMMSSLVIDWGLDEPCTQEVIMDVFHEAPHIRDFVDNVSGERGNFFKKPSID